MGRRQAFVFLLLLVTSIGCDHAAKELARSALEGAAPISWAGDAVRFELALNPGAFLSLGSGLPQVVRDALFVGLVPLLLAALCGLAVRAGLPSWLSLIGLALVAGGGLANWLDRMLHGGTVTDYVSLGVGGMRTGIFNLADLAIMAGVALFLFAGNRSEPAAPERDTSKEC